MVAPTRPHARSRERKTRRDTSRSVSEFSDQRPQRDGEVAARILLELVLKGGISQMTPRWTTNGDARLVAVPLEWTTHFATSTFVRASHPAVRTGCHRMAVAERALAMLVDQGLVSEWGVSGDRRMVQLSRKALDRLSPSTVWKDRPCVVSGRSKPSRWDTTHGAWAREVVAMLLEIPES